MMLLILISFSFDYSIISKINFAYSDNIFEYSNKYLDEFINRIRPERFPFESYDDLYSNYELQLLFRNKFFNQRTTTFNFDFVGYNYLINQQKDYIILKAGIRQSFGKWAMKLEYLHLPSYLIRYYPDPEGNQYIGCEFSEKLLSSKTSLKLGQNKEIAFLLGYEIDDYIESFNIYDAKALRFNPHIYFAVSKKIDAKIDYEFKSSIAKGPLPDVSYVQHRFGLKNHFHIGFPRLSKLICCYQVKYRIYTTEVSPIIDTPHSGRNDITQIFDFNLQFPVFNTLYFEAGYSYKFRRSHSDIYPDIGWYKNYNIWEINGGIEFEY
ncbi:MAG: hypothetical protein ACUVQT_02095 [bacterium]